MKDRWLLVDARAQVAGVNPATKVAGLSLLARHARLAARREFAGLAVLTADQDTRAACAQALERQPPPSLAIEYTAEEPAPGERAWVRVPLCAVYTASGLGQPGDSDSAPAPLVEIADRADLRAAERALFSSIRKSVDMDGVVAYYAFRAISQRITKLLLDTPVTPNHVSLCAMAFGISGALCAAAGTFLGFALAGVLFWTGAMVDCVDGEIARLRLQGSKLGEWLDSLADEVSTYGILCGIGVGLLRAGYDRLWPAIAFAGAVAGVLVHIKLYWDLHRMGRPIDSAQYPWFFGTPGEGAVPTSIAGQLFYGVGFLFRRDAFVTVIAALLIAGQPHIAAVILAGGAALVTILLLAHLTVGATRST